MAEYQSLAVLRRELTSNDADDRVDAYVAVKDAGLDPEDDVLVQNVDEFAVEKLVESGVIPEPADDGNVTASDQRQEMLRLLRSIAGESGGED